MKLQATAVLRNRLQLSSRHQAKQEMKIRGSKSTGKIHSLATFAKYTAALAQAGEWVKTTEGIRYLDELQAQSAQDYLYDRAASGIGQKQLDADRSALELLLGQGRLERQFSLVETKLEGRAYTANQIVWIAAKQSPQNALATLIAWRAGLRAHELLTLAPISAQSQASSHRNWHTDRFAGREGERHVVTGKGGLRREVLLPFRLADRLEAVRLESPRIVTDRGIRYQQHLDLSGGNRWSKSFGTPHGEPSGGPPAPTAYAHTYAQERVEELQNFGKTYAEARKIASQELGHFRADIVEVYLR